jgi:hypothetical protein
VDTAVTLVLGLLLSALFSLAAGWALMLAVGVIHHEWIPQCPTIGYWWAVLLAMLLRGALHTIATSGSER